MKSFEQMLETMNNEDFPSGLKFKNISKPDKNNYKTVIFATPDGRDIYPIMVSAKLPDHFINGIVADLTKYFRQF